MDPARPDGSLDEPFPGRGRLPGELRPAPRRRLQPRHVVGGRDREVSGAYVEVDRPRKLVFTWIGPLTNNVNTLVTVELTPHGDETELVLTHERLPTAAIHDGHTRGWGNILDHLAEAVAKDL